MKERKKKTEDISGCERQREIIYMQTNSIKIRYIT